MWLRKTLTGEALLDGAEVRGGELGAGDGRKGKEDGGEHCDGCLRALDWLRGQMKR